VGVLVFGIKQYTVMLSRAQSVVNSYVEKNNPIALGKEGFSGFPDDRPINIAFAVAQFGYEELRADEYADYGTMNAYYEVWDEEGNDNFHLLKTRPCSPEDFGLGEDGAPPTTFFQVEPKQVSYFESHMKMLQCFVEPIKLQGNWNTGSATVLILSFDKCDPTVRKTCKSDEEV
jgi:hypothetical protein